MFHRLRCGLLILGIALVDVPMAYATTVSVSNQKGQNLLTYSEQFDHVAWIKDSSGTGVIPIVTSNYTMAPDGTLTADRIQFDKGAGSGYSRIQQGPASALQVGVAETFSVWLKTNDGSTKIVGMRMNASGVTVTVTSTWKRFTFTYVADHVTPSHQLILWDGLATDNTADISAWGGQSNRGQISAYNKTTATAVNGSYVPAGATKSNQLGQNAFTYSEQLNNAAWSKTRTSATVDATTAPDGTATAEKISEDNTNNSHLLNRSIATVTGKTYTLSIYAKAAERPAIWLYPDNFSYGPAEFDLANGLVYFTPAGTKSVISRMGNGWYRCSTTFKATATGNVPQWFALALSVTNGNYQGDGVSGLYLWGAQFTGGGVPGPYNKTIATAINTSYVPAGTAQSSQLGQNLLINSEQISNWNTGVGAVVTANAVMAPDGTKTAEQIDYTVATDGYVYSSAGTITEVRVGTAYTASIWLWSTTKTSIGIRMYSYPSDNRIEAHRTVTLTSTPTRYSLTSSIVAGGTDTAVVLDLENRAVYGSDGLAGTVYVWGGQVITGSKPGAYNKTTTTARNPNYLP